MWKLFWFEFIFVKVNLIQKVLVHPQIHKQMNQISFANFCFIDNILNFVINTDQCSIS